MEKILVIDDEKPTLAMFRLTLSALGYVVLTAENGREGLSVFQQERPAVVLTDIKMPGMDGIEVLRRIKEMDSGTEVIVITGHGDMDLAIQALNLDATDFINKPIGIQALEQALKRAHERMELSRTRKKQIYVRHNQAAAIICVRGSVTADSEPDLQEAYRDAAATKREIILLLFEPNVSINGAGMAVLTQVLLEGRRDGRRMLIAGLSDNFRKVFEIVGITKLAEVFETEAEALGASDT